jgi:hypothetical protein
MYNSQNIDEFYLRNLLQTVLHAHLYLQHVLDTIIRHLQGEVHLQHINTTGDVTSDNTVTQRLNAIDTTTTMNTNGDANNNPNTDAEVPNITVHDSIPLQDIEAQEEYTNVLCND